MNLSIFAGKVRLLLGAFEFIAQRDLRATTLVCQLAVKQCCRSGFN